MFVGAFLNTDLNSATVTPLTRRIPNLLHFLLFLALTVFALLVAEVIVLALAHPSPLVSGLIDQKTQLIANGLTYVLALGGATFLFPALWKTGFLDGIRWNAAAARWPWIFFGLLLGFVSQGISNLLPAPNKMPIEEVFHNHALIWLLVIFGTLLAPLFEEILFRGFLLLGIAIAVDYMQLSRHGDPAETLHTWRMSETYSTPALWIASLIVSALFALIHAPQLGGNWAAVGLLAVVSLIFCYLRVRFHSVALTTLIHATYNFSVFASIFVATGGFRHLDRL